MKPAFLEIPRKIMSEGTSLDDIESGNVRDAADNAVMDAIMSDMNAYVEERHPPSSEIYTPAPEPVQQPPAYMFQPPPPPLSQMEAPMMPPMFPQMGGGGGFGMQPTYERIEEESPASNSPPPASFSGPKRNGWADAFDSMRDPMIVGLLVSLFSLPALHTWLAGRAKWAYKVGGSLSWLGFIVQFLVVGGIFAAWRYGVQMLGV
jgi:hypothetical protein